MFKLSKEEQAIVNRILKVIMIITITWIAFYEILGLLPMSTGIKRIIVLALFILSTIIAYWQVRKIARPMVELQGQLSASIKNSKIQSEQLLESQKIIENSKLRYNRLFELTSEGLFDMDVNYNMTYYSVDWYKKIGVDTSISDFEEWSRFVIDEDKHIFQNKIGLQIQGRKQDYISEYRIKDKHNQIHWIRGIARAKFDDENRFVSMSGVHRDITSFKEHDEVILKMAYYDRLTGLANRLKFEEMVNETIAELDYFAVLYIDVDNFKYINDTYSHQVGDEVLVAMSKRLQKIVDSDDCIAHLSGDEFGIISKKYKSKEAIEEYTKYILDQLSIPYAIGKLSLSFTASIGISIYPDNGDSFKDILVNLDIALYEAKDTTKNSYRFFKEKMRIKSLEQANLESHLIKSLELNEIFITYQPVMNLKTNKIKGFEALLRWEDTEYGLVFPDVFIPIAEKTGFIHQLGDYVLEQSVIFAKELYKQYGRFFTINVNVSAVQLRKAEFVDRVQEVLVKHQLPAEYLNLEITESIALELDKKVIGRLTEIRKKGIDISLDDFGTGYSSLNSLVNLSVTHIKIDKSLVQQATTLKEVHKLIRGVVEFAHALELKVVAEGVETQNMELIISDMQIDYSQGYYYAKPLIEEDVYKFIEENNE